MVPAGVVFDRRHKQRETAWKHVIPQRNDEGHIAPPPMQSLKDRAPKSCSFTFLPYSGAQFDLDYPPTGQNLQSL